MAFVLRRRAGSVSPFRVLFWAFAFGLVLLFLFDRRPFVISADDPQTGGSYEDELVDGAVLVLVSVEETRSRTRRGEFVRPFAWVDALRQEYGPVSVMDVENLQGDALGNYRFVIVTESAGSSPRMF